MQHNELSEQNDLIVLAFFAFGPGGPDYETYFKRWIEKNRELPITFVILTDSAFATETSEYRNGFTATLINHKADIEHFYNVKIDVIDIREHKDKHDFLYVDWLLTNVSIHASQGNKPVYAFISDASRYIGLLLLSKRYPNAQNIFLAEADTHGIRKNFLGDQFKPEAGFKFFGDDRALILLKNDSNKGQEILKKYCAAYTNLYELVLHKDPINLSLSSDLVAALMRYQGEPNEEQVKLYLSQIDATLTNEYRDWLASQIKNTKDLNTFLIMYCGHNSRNIFENEGVARQQLEENEQNNPDFTIDFPQAMAIEEGQFGYWHDALGNWQNKRILLEPPDKQYWRLATDPDPNSTLSSVQSSSESAVEGEDKARISTKRKQIKPHYNAKEEVSEDEENSAEKTTERTSGRRRRFNPPGIFEQTSDKQNPISKAKQIGGEFGSDQQKNPVESITNETVETEDYESNKISTGSESTLAGQRFSSFPKNLNKNDLNVTTQSEPESGPEKSESNSDLLGRRSKRGTE